MIKRKVPLSDLDKSILKSNLYTAFIIAAIFTIILLSIPLSFLGFVASHWTIGKGIIFGIACLFPVAPVLVFMLYRRSMSNTDKIIYTGIISNKRLPKEIFQEHLTIDGTKIFINGPIDQEQSDSIKEFDSVEIHWLPKCQRMLYVKKTEPICLN